MEYYNVLEKKKEDLILGKYSDESNQNSYRWSRKF